MTQGFTVMQDAVRSLSYEDKVYLSLENYEEMTDEELLKTISI